MLSPYAILIPFPPPPALALIITGYPISSAILTASSPDSMMPYGSQSPRAHMSSHGLKRSEQALGTAAAGGSNYDDL